MNIINEAEGAFVIPGGYVAFFFTEAMVGMMPGAPHLMWIVPSMFVAAAAAALFFLIVFKLVIEKVLDWDLFVSLLATFGIELLMQRIMTSFLQLRSGCLMRS